MLSTVMMCILLVLVIVMIVSTLSSVYFVFKPNKEALTLKLAMVGICTGGLAWAIVSVMAVLQVQGRI